MLQRNSDGTAMSGFSFIAASNGIDVVAVCESDSDRRQALWWYGDATVGMESDSDGDMYTFAEELADGTSPIDGASHPVRWADSVVTGAVVCASSAIAGFDMRGYATYTIRSAPEGVLFETKVVSVPTNTNVTTPSYSPNNSAFAFWCLNGVEQRDANGTAKSSFSFVAVSNGNDVVAVCENDTETRQKLWWYGDASIEMDSDTDGDRYSFAEELSDGTSPIDGSSRPIRWADAMITGGVVCASSESIAYNFQFYEQPTGVLVDNQYTELFTSVYADNGATSRTFGANLQPVVADVNGDDLWDLVLVSDSGVKVLMNVGAKGNPEFEERVVDVSAVDLAMNSTEKLNTLNLDTPVIGALSATVWGEALLASDTEGRIWFYASQTPQTFVLQNKVWGGSHPGFAQGLRLAAVDWDDDGDLDCLCGTAEGKLMLLRDPKVGRPTNLKVLVGVDNVKLDWDPNQQSRIRGYKVYRADAGAEDFTSLVSPYTPLPTYRDYPPSVSDFDYKVSSVSRHYVAGDSEPFVSESPATEVVRASLGKVKFFWNDAVAKQGERAEVLLSIENSLNYDVAGKTQVVTFDPAYLVPLKIIKTGLTENVSYEESVIDGKWTITLKSGNLAAGGGKFFSLVFDTLKAGTTKVGEATVTIVARQEPAPYRLGDVTGDGVVDDADLRLLGKLKSAAGRKWTANQLKAGDFNGNGKLDEADYQALRDLLKEKGLL